MSDDTKPTIVTVQMQVEFNRSAWQEEYGSIGDPGDIESYLYTTISGCPAAEAGAFTVKSVVVN